MPKITILDGARSIGGSKIHLQTQGMGILLDFGMNYKRWGEFYAEFLGPRSPRGINDFLVLGILPPLKGVYRDDVFPNDFDKDSFLNIELPVDAVFLTHAHKDHCQHIGLLREDIPIYCSPLTATIMKAMQDTAGSSLFDEMVYFARRKPGEENGILQSEKNWKIGKQVFILGEKNDAVDEFWLRSPYAEKHRFEMRPLSLVEENKINDIEFRYFPVDHSIPGATAFAFLTDYGWIVYTGDLRLHGRKGDLTDKFIEEVSSLQPLALIIEGTHLEEKKSNSRDKIKQITEEDVCSKCLEEVNKAQGKLVVADFAPRNIERLISFLHIARETNRKLCVLPNDIYLLEVIDSVEGQNHSQDEHLAIFEKVKDSKDNWEKKIRERYSKEKFVKYSDINRNPGDYILCFSFFDINHLTDITCTGGIYIYSSSEAFEEEQYFDFFRLKRWLEFLGLTPVGFSIDEENKKPNFYPGYHCSGHATREDLLDIVDRIRPKYLIPVHTELEKPYEELRDITQIIWDDAKYPELEVKIYGEES